MKGVLTILVGLPASGKSMFCEHTRCKNKVVVSSDKIRETMFGDVNDRTHNMEVFNEMFRITRESLNDGCNVFYDATNVSRKRRINLINSLKGSFDECNCVITAVPYSVCLSNNRFRGRFVPEEVITRMYKSFYTPHYDEGFNNIRIIRQMDYRENITETLEKCMNVSQDNPHHTLTIGKHCVKARGIAPIWSGAQAHNLSESERYILSNACLFHDIGKLFTKTFTDARGNKTDNVHFYNHQNVGAYDVLCSNENDFFFSDKELIEISTLINNHMCYYTGELDKVKEIYNNRFLELLELLHNADMGAH